MGYWTGKRRLDVHASTPDKCDLSPFVWEAADGQLLPEEQWESSVWVDGDPNCIFDAAATEYPTETFVAVSGAHNQYVLYDINYAYMHCAVCELDP